jgi:hypothetical protein
MRLRWDGIIARLSYRFNFLTIRGDPGQKIADVAEEIGAQLVVVGHRPQGPLARWWFGSVSSYLVKRLRCSVLVGQTEISDDEFEQLKQPGEMRASDPAPVVPVGNQTRTYR